MKKFIVVVIILGGLIVANGCQPSNSPQDDTLKYIELIKLNPKYADAYYSRGDAKGKLSDPTGVLAKYTEAIKQNPKDEQSHYERGMFKMIRQDYAGAITDFTKVIRLNPKAGVTYYNRGNAKGKLKDLKGAIADFTKAIQLWPATVEWSPDKRQFRINNLAAHLLAEVYYSRGSAKVILQDYEGAIADLTEAIEIDPEMATAYGLRGDAKGMLRDYVGAIADYNNSSDLGVFIDDKVIKLVRQLVKSERKIKHTPTNPLPVPF